MAPRLAEMGVEYDGWQRGVATLALGHDVHGRYAATVGGVTMSVPRQVGKTFTVGSLLLAMCVAYPGLRVVWTSHHGRTTTNTFRAIQSMVRRKGMARHMPANGGIRTANGEQEVQFANGSLIMFGAREHGFGVGIDAIDLMVFDEAQRLSSRALADMVPTTNQARHQHGALLFFIGTPPRPENKGDEFAARRRKALAGKLNAGVFVEFSADEDADYEDPEQWRKANPSYPHRTPHESMLRMQENLNDEADWRREAMGVWDDDVAAVVPAIPSDAWAACRVAPGDAPGDLPEAFALSMSPSREASVAWSAAGHVELAQEGERVDDTDLLVEWFVERCGRRRVVYIDGRDPAASLVGELRRRKVKVNVTTVQDSARGCGLLFSEVTQGRLTHIGQEQVDDLVAAAEEVPVGKAGAWEWDPSDPNLAPLRAITLARFGASLRPKRQSSGPKRVVVLS